MDDKHSIKNQDSLLNDSRLPLHSKLKKNRDLPIDHVEGRDIPEVYKQFIVRACTEVNCYTL